MTDCHKCGVVLSSENWHPSRQRVCDNICKECNLKKCREWRKANPERAKAIDTRKSRKEGHKPFNENRECTSFLGVHIAERVLSKVFKDVEVMPMCNPGYDFVCSRDKRIDVKSSCTCKDHPPHDLPYWQFHIGHNTTADFFLCLAFDNRENLNPLHAWLLPGSKFSHLANTTIRPSTLHKWAEYRLDLSKIDACCDILR